jgi:hypothetical protein
LMSLLSRSASWWNRTLRLRSSAQSPGMVREWFMSGQGTTKVTPVLEGQEDRGRRESGRKTRRMSGDYYGDVGGSMGGSRRSGKVSGFAWSFTDPCPLRAAQISVYTGGP